MQFGQLKRREFITLLGGVAAAWPLAARGQQSAMPVIGFLNPGFHSNVWTALIGGLRDIGYVDGETIKIEPRWALGRPETLPGLAQELVRLKAEVVVAVGRPSIEAVRAATTDLPIVAVDLESDPVESGFVASLARPGGNLTGLFLDLPTLCGKWLQLIGEAVPGIAIIAVLWDSKTGSHQLNAMKAAARMMSVDLMSVEFHDSVGLDAALNAGMKERPQVLIQLGSHHQSVGRSHCGYFGKSPRSKHIPVPVISGERWLAILWPGPDQHVLPGGSICFENPQGRQAVRSADRAPDQIRIRHQPQDRQVAWHNNPTDPARAGRRRDRVVYLPHVDVAAPAHVGSWHEM